MSILGWIALIFGAALAVGWLLTDSLTRAGAEPAKPFFLYVAGALIAGGALILAFPGSA